MNIDWSKAPQWADRVLAMGMAGAWAWANEHQYQYIGKINKEIFLYEEENTWSLSDGELVEMRAPAEVWQGTGLPPVGTVCETERNEFLRRVEILYIGVERVFVRDENGEEIALLLEGREFFPIRTQEQIEAEEREREIDELCATIFTHYGNPKGSEHYLGLATKLHQEGYRKQPKEDA